VTFTSSSTVEAFSDMIPFPLPPGVVYAAIGPVTAGTARAHGLQPVVVAREASAASLVEALVSSLKPGPQEGT
jgi:uroporphyrinogen-III synthase